MKCEICMNEMELKDSNYYDDEYWEGYKCNCGNVELITYTKDEYEKNMQKMIKIKQFEYMQICPKCNYLFEFMLTGVKCLKCHRFYTYDNLYEIKTGGCKLIEKDYVKDNAFIEFINKNIYVK